MKIFNSLYDWFTNFIEEKEFKRTWKIVRNYYDKTNTEEKMITDWTDITS